MPKKDEKKEYICDCPDGSLYRKKCPYADKVGRCGLPSTEGWDVKCPGEKEYR